VQYYNQISSKAKSPEVSFRGDAAEQETEARMSPLKHIAKVSCSGTSHGGSNCDS